MAPRAHHVAARVNRQRHAAVRAVDGARALPAEDRGRVAAPVQQHEHLLPPLEPRADGLRQRLAEHDIGAAVGELVAHVDQRHVRERPVEHAPLDREQFIAARGGVLVTLERRRGRAQDDERAFTLGPHDGHVAPVIARALLLLVGSVVLFVHDDQADRTQRREYCRPGADDDVHVAAADAVPLIVPLAV